MQRRFQETLSHPKSLARETNKKTPQTKQKRKCCLFFFIIIIQRLKNKEVRLQLRATVTKLPTRVQSSTAGGRAEMKERGRPTEHIFPFLFFFFL